MLHNLVHEAYVPCNCDLEVWVRSLASAGSAMHCTNMAAQEPGIFPWLESLGARTEVASDLASLDYKSALGRPVMLMTDFLAAHDVWLWLLNDGGAGVGGSSPQNWK